MSRGYPNGGHRIGRTARGVPPLSVASPRFGGMSATHPLPAFPAQPASPAEVRSTPVDGVDVLGALSPSRAGDFMTCPLLYRYRTIDRLPEEPSADALRGTLVHKVLEDLFDLPSPTRTPDRARDLLLPTWDALLEAEPTLAELFTGEGPEVADWLASCRVVLDRYFLLEDPRRLEPAERELYVEALLDSKLLLRGFVDRLDVAADGAIRIVDYKSGKSPGEMFEAKALFQMKFYALVIWRTRGVVPAMLQLVYLGNAEILRYVPDEHDLLATERKVEAIWRAIRIAEESGDWRPRRSRLCDWCSFQALCPEFGGTPPPLPDRTGGSGELTVADVD
jgi:putative RecB family exonuclease